MGTIIALQKNKYSFLNNNNTQGSYIREKAVSFLNRIHKINKIERVLRTRS